MEMIWTRLNPLDEAYQLNGHNAYRAHQSPTDYRDWWAFAALPLGLPKMGFPTKEAAMAHVENEYKTNFPQTP